MIKGILKFQILITIVVSAYSSDNEKINFDTSKPGTIEFLNFLSNQNSKTAIFLLRQYLFSTDSIIRKTTAQLLINSKDEESFLLRDLVLHDSIGKTLQKIPVSKYYNKEYHPVTYINAIEAALAYSFREEIPHISFFQNIFDSILIQKLNWNKNDTFYYDFNNFYIKNQLNSNRNPSIIGDSALEFNTEKNFTKRPAHYTVSFDQTPADPPDTLLTVANLKGTWVRGLTRYSTKPFVFKNAIFIGDGRGNIQKIEAESGMVIWSISLPLPIFSYFVNSSTETIEVYIPVTTKETLIVGLNSETGILQFASMKNGDNTVKNECAKNFHHGIEKDTSITISTDSFSINWNRTGGKGKLTLYRKDSVLITKPFDPMIIKVINVHGNIVLLGKWGYSAYGISLFNTVTKTSAWNNYLENFQELIEMKQINDSLLLLYSNESELVILNLIHGTCVFRNTFAHLQYESPLTDIQICTNNGVDRLIVDPSNGALYSIPLDILLRKYNLKEIHPRFEFDYEDIFTSKAYAGPLDTSISNEEQLFDLYANRLINSKFDNIRFMDSTKIWDTYSKQIVDEAKSKGYETELLANLIKEMKPKSFKYGVSVPVNAFLSRYKNQEVWVIVCLWGYDMIKDLGHINMNVFSRKTGKKLAYNTCG